MTSAKNTGGGKGTTAGTTFQENILTWLATLCLAEQAALAPGALEAGTTVTAVRSESHDPIDDIVAVTSTDGRLYFQAKTSINISTKSGDLPKVAKQFLQQIRAGVILGHKTRPIDLNRDRFFLSVNSTSPGTIRRDLRNALNAVRSADGTQLKEGIRASLNKAESKAISAFEDCLVSVGNAMGAPISSDEKARILRVTYVTSHDFFADGADRREVIRLLKNSVLVDPSTAESAHAALIAICREFAPARTGGDRSYFVSELERLEYPLRNARSYDASVRSLRSNTDTSLSQLEKHTGLRYRNTRIEIKRDSTFEAIAFASETHTIITGEPGSGKSATIHAFTRAMVDAGHDTVLLLADRLSAGSEHELSNELHLPKGFLLTDVLANWPGESPAFLVIDALDTARLGKKQKTFSSLVEDVQSRAPRWTVVASMREYDLRRSHLLPSQFPGVPHTKYCQNQLSSIRHLSVPHLGDAELDQVSLASPDLDTALSSTSSELRATLARNPFNLQLFLQILQDYPDTDTSPIKTELDLLDRYWSLRVEDIPGSPIDTLPTVQKLVDSMVSAKALGVLKPQAGLDASDSNPLQTLLENGVINEDPGNLEGDPSKLSFSHNILYDYAVARVKFQSLPDQVIEWLSNPQNEDVFLAVRPSLVIAYRRLWHTTKSGDTSIFWKRAVQIQKSNMRPVGKIIASTVAAREFRSLDDLTSLLEETTGTISDETIDLIQNLVSAYLADHKRDALESPLVGEGAPEYLKLAETLATRDISKAFWIVRSILFQVNQSTADTTEPQISSLGVAARLFLRESLESGRVEYIASIGIDAVCSSFESDKDASEKSLRLCIEKTAAQEYGHATFRDLGDNLSTIAAFSPALAIDVADEIFNNESSQDGEVTSGSRILSMTIRKQDLYSMAQYAVATDFDEIMRQDPVVATRIAIIAAEYEAYGRPSNTRREILKIGFPLLGNTAQFAEDYSYIWSTGEHNKTDNWHRIVVALKKSLIDFGQNMDTASIELVIGTLAEHNHIALLWSTAIQAATEEPKSVGAVMLPTLEVPEVFNSSDSEYAASKFLQAVYPLVEDDQRSKIENAILNIPETVIEDMREYAESRRDSLLLLIDESLFVLPETMTARNAIDMNTPPAGPLPPSNGIGWTSVSEDEDLEQSGVDIRSPWVTEARSALSVLRNYKATPKSSIEEARGVVDKVRSFENLLSNSDAPGFDLRAVVYGQEYVFHCCAELAGIPEIINDSELFNFVVSRLEKGSVDHRPETSKEPQQDSSDSDFDSMSWGSPSPRIDTAIGFMKLAQQSKTLDKRVRKGILLLIKDPVPTVRHQISCSLNRLWNADRGLMWQLADMIASSERHRGTMQYFFNMVVGSLDSTGANEVDPVVQTVYQRFPGTKRIAGGFATYCLRRALREQEGNYQKVVASFLEDPVQFKHEVRSLITSSREILAGDGGSDDPVKNMVAQNRVVEYLTKVCQKSVGIYAALRDRHPERPFELSDEEQATLSEICSQVDLVANQVYFASGAFDNKRSSKNGLDVPLHEEHQQRASDFFDAAHPLVHQLCQIPFVQPAYQTLQTLEYLLPANPKKVIIDVATLVRVSRDEGLQHEHMASELIVRLVGGFLVEYRSIFQNIAEVQSAVLDILDVFIEAGWPSAADLTHRLDEVYR